MGRQLSCSRETGNLAFPGVTFRSCSFPRWDEKAGLQAGCDTLPILRRARGTKKRRPAMQKISTMRTTGSRVFKGQLTIGLDLGDRYSSYCVLNEAGEIV